MIELLRIGYIRRFVSFSLSAIVLMTLLIIPMEAQSKKIQHGHKKREKINYKTMRGKNYDEEIAIPLFNSFIADSAKVDDPMRHKSIEEYYNTLNKDGKQQFQKAILDKTVELLEYENKKGAIALTHLYSNVAELKDEKLPTMLYIRGTIYAEMLDSINVKKTILHLKKCHQSKQTADYTNKLNSSLEKIRNFEPPLKKMTNTIWVSGPLDFNCGLQSIGGGDKSVPPLVLKSCDEYSYEEHKLINSFTIIEKASPLVKKLNMDYDCLRTRMLYHIGCDSICAVWCSEKLKGDKTMVFAPILRDVASTAAAHINAEYSQRNKHDFGTEIAVNVATSVGEVLFNSLIDAIFTPSKKLYSIMALLKYENDYTITGTLHYYYAKIDAYGNVKDREFATSSVTFYRYEPESGLIFEDNHGKKFPNVQESVLGLKYLSQYGNVRFSRLLKDLENSYVRHKIFSQDDSIKAQIIILDSLLNTKSYRELKDSKGASHMLNALSPPFGAKYRNITNKDLKKLGLENKEGVCIKKLDKDLQGLPYNKYLKKDDVIVAINDKRISNVDDMDSIMSQLHIGDRIAFSVIRDNKSISVHMFVSWRNLNNDNSNDSSEGYYIPDIYNNWKNNGAKNNRDAWNQEQYKWLLLYNDSVLSTQGIKSHLLDKIIPDVGLKVTDITDKVKGKIKIRKGAYVDYVNDLGAANIAGIKEKDIILSVNGIEITSAIDFDSIVMYSVPGDWLRCCILRNKEKLEMPIRVTWK